MLNSEGRKGYRHIHLWLLIPLFITLYGFRGYWLNFSNNAFVWHLHSLSATLWFLVLVIQPYLITKGDIAKHRTFGMLGLLVAGIVAASALAVIRGHINNLDPSLDGFIYEFRYSLSLTDLIYISGFIFSISMAIVHRHAIDWHSRWMLSSVFWVFSPALDRATYGIIQITGNEFASWFNFATQFFISHGLIVVLLTSLLLLDRRLGIKTWLPYSIVIVAQIVTPVLLIQLKNSNQLASWFEMLF